MKPECTSINIDKPNGYGSMQPFDDGFKSEKASAKNSNLTCLKIGKSKLEKIKQAVVFIILTFTGFFILPYYCLWMLYGDVGKYFDVDIGNCSSALLWCFSSSCHMIDELRMLWSERKVKRGKMIENVVAENFTLENLKAKMITPEATDLYDKSTNLLHFEIRVYICEVFAMICFVVKLVVKGEMRSDLQIIFCYSVALFCITSTVTFMLKVVQYRRLIFFCLSYRALRNYHYYFSLL